MIRRPPRSTLSSSSAASDVYKRQINAEYGGIHSQTMGGKGSTLKERAELANKSTTLAIGELDLDSDDLEKALSLCEPSLRSMEASVNKIKRLPALLMQFTNLKQLNLAQNRLSSLPAEVFLRLTALEKLNLDSNLLSDLPDLSPLVKLKELHASNNQIKIFPVVIPPKLQELVLTNNKLIQLPEKDTVWGEATRLVGLDVSDNQIDVLPGSLSQTPALRSLKAANNRLSGIPVEVLRDTKSDHCAGVVGADLWS
eukprot:TRINITY_DN27733_c0_g1_i2.p1 TRINITY_DN27733_c0_g1~~TRINITY_DN27733_c0_g1_i2.p1  ORF type:complete len:255 (+),score=86.61 TRINITY_DN27733_c0_g1_i2:88-852(+)